MGRKIPAPIRILPEEPGGPRGVASVGLKKVLAKKSITRTKLGVVKISQNPVRELIIIMPRVIEKGQFTVGDQLGRSGGAFPPESTATAACGSNSWSELFLLEILSFFFLWYVEFRLNHSKLPIGEVTR